MNSDVVGGGLAPDQMDALEQGLTRMGRRNATIAVVDDFVEQVQRRTGATTYSSERGAGVVAAKTVRTPDGFQIVFNAPELRELPLEAFERLAAHEAGHIILNERNEGITGRQHLVDTEWRWWLLCIAAFALDELRIERCLADLGYPVASTGEVQYVDEAMFWLNCELMSALVDPASAETKHLRDSVAATHDWVAKHLAYVAAFSDGLRVDLSALSQYSRDNWDDYIASNWSQRAHFYAAIPDARSDIDESSLASMLLGLSEKRWI